MKNSATKRLVPLMLLALALSACSHKIIEVDAPCPDFGKHCPQKPIK